MTFRCHIIEKKDLRWFKGSMWDSCTVPNLIQEIGRQFSTCCDKHEEIEIIAIGGSAYAYFPSEENIIRWDKISDDE